MKKFILSCFLSALCLTTAFAVDDSGSCGANLHWELNSSTGVLTISGTGAMNDYPSIDAPWYKHRSLIKTISLNDEVTSVGDYAFRNCTNLTSISMGNSLTTIGNSAFLNCSSLNTINFSNQITTIDDFAFSECTSLEDITFPSCLIQIGSGAFTSCTSLTSITIPENVTYVGSYAFNACSSLKSIQWDAVTCESAKKSEEAPFFNNRTQITSFTFGSNVTYIPSYLCYGMTKLSSVTIPKSLTSYGESIFTGCSSIHSISWEAIDCQMNVETQSESIFADICSQIGSITFGNEVVNIPAYLCGIMSSIESISLPTSLKSIGEEAFYGCSSITSIAIPQNVNTIGVGAFNECKAVTSFTVDSKNNSFSSVSGVLFDKNQTKLIQYPIGKSSTSYTIPNTVSSIEKYSFNSSNLSTITIPECVISIGNGAFGNCSKLNSIAVPNSVTSVGEYAFNLCTSLTSVTLSNALQEIKSSTFSGCKSLSSITLPDGVTKIGESAFSECQAIANISIPANITTIEDMAFFKCSSLRNVKVYAVNPPSIKPATFAGCLSIEVKVPCNSLSLYQNTLYWKDMTLQGFGGNCGEDTPATIFTVTVSSNNTSMGSVSGGGTYEEGATATVTATPKSGYKFTKWSDGSKKNPYSFTVTKDITLTAYFEKKEDASTSTFWNFSDDAFKSLGTISSSKTINGLTINATSSKNVVIDASSQSIDNIAFTHRLKLNGAGDASARSLKFNVDGDCTIDIYLKSGSSSEDRTLRIDFGSFGSNNKKTITASKSSITKETLTYSGAATSVFVYGTGSGVNLYGIRVTTTSSSTDPIEISCAEAVQIASSLDHNKPTTNIYTVTGFVTETDGKVSNGQQIFWMADTQDGGKVFECYWGNVPEVVVAGDEVAVTGNLLRYNSTYEIKNGTVEILSRAQGIDNLQDAPCVPHKILRDNQVLILRGDKTYTVTGQEVK